MVAGAVGGWFLDVLWVAASAHPNLHEAEVSVRVFECSSPRLNDGGKEACIVAGTGLRASVGFALVPRKSSES